MRGWREWRSGGMGSGDIEVDVGSGKREALVVLKQGLGPAKERNLSCSCIFTNLVPCS